MARNPNAGPTPPQPGDIDPDEGAGNVTGLTVNEQAIHAMRKAASIVRYCTLTLRDEADRAGTPHSPPRTDGSLDDTPKLARWVALANAYTLTTAPPENVVHAIAGDLITAETATYRASTLAASTGHPSTSPATTTTPATSVNASPALDGCGPRSEPKSCLTSCDHNPEHTVEPGTLGTARVAPASTSATAPERHGETRPKTRPVTVILDNKPTDSAYLTPECFDETSNPKPREPHGRASPTPSVTEARPAPTRQAGVRLLTGVPRVPCAVTGDRTQQTLPFRPGPTTIPTRTLRGETGGAGVIVEASRACPPAPGSARSGMSKRRDTPDLTDAQSAEEMRPARL